MSFAIFSGSNFLVSIEKVVMSDIKKKTSICFLWFLWVSMRAILNIFRAKIAYFKIVIFVVKKLSLLFKIFNLLILSNEKWNSKTKWLLSKFFVRNLTKKKQKFRKIKTSMSKNSIFSILYFCEKESKSRHLMIYVISNKIFFYKKWKQNVFTLFEEWRTISFDMWIVLFMKFLFIRINFILFLICRQNYYYFLNENVFQSKTF